MTELHLLLCGAAVLFAFGIAFLLTPFARRFSYRVGAIDIPRDARRIHNRPMPRMGGLSMVLAFFLGCAVFGVSPHLTAPLAVGGSLLCALGMVDDVKALPPLVKLLGQLLCAVCTVALGIRIPFFGVGERMLPLAGWSGVVSVLWILLLTNAFNLIDGLDGLSCGVGAISALSLVLLSICRASWEQAIPSALLLGACLGFFPYNRNPATVFAGDTGALFLGYVLSVLSADGLYKTHLLTAAVTAFLLFAFPLGDTLCAIVRRLAKGKSPFRADRGHLHHRLLDLGHTPKQAVKILFCLCAAGAVTALIWNDLHFAAVGVSLLCLLLWLCVRLFKTGNP